MSVNGLLAAALAGNGCLHGGASLLAETFEPGEILPQSLVEDCFYLFAVIFNNGAGFHEANLRSTGLRLFGKFE